MAGRPISVAVVSDVPLVAAGVRSLLQALGDSVEVLELGERAVCDVALFDPTGRPDEDERRLTELVADPRCRTVAVYSVGWSDRAMRDALRLGVDSFLPKTMPPSDLAAALIDVAAGRPIDAARRAGRTRRAASWLGRGDGLTERESQVLVLCAEGLSNQEIADALYVNVETVKSHLKHAYSRLGVRNRAQAAAYVHRCAPPLPATALVGRADAPPVSHIAAAHAVDPRELPPVDAEQLAERVALLDLGPERRACLARYANAVASGADEYVDRLIERWSQHPATGPFVADAAAAARLAAAQRRYVADLFGGEFDAEHAASMLAAGVVHHRLRLPPQWYLASYAHVICDHLPLLVADGVADVDAITVLVASTLFDAALVLDAYELAVTSELSATVTPAPAPGGSPAIADGPLAAPRRRRPVTEIPQHLDEAASRCAFLGIDVETIAVLRRSGAGRRVVDPRGARPLLRAADRARRAPPLRTR